MTESRYQWTSDGLVLSFRLTPKSSRDAVEGYVATADGKTVLKAAVRAVPENGAANRALLLLVAKWSGPAEEPDRDHFGCDITPQDNSGAGRCDATRSLYEPARYIDVVTDPLITPNVITRDRTVLAFAARVSLPFSTDAWWGRRREVGLIAVKLSPLSSL